MLTYAGEIGTNVTKGIASLLSGTIFGPKVSEKDLEKM